MRPISRPILFLDCDGVLNNSHSLGIGIDLDPDCVDQLRRILIEVDPEVVLSSTWRLYSELAREIWWIVGKWGKSTPSSNTLVTRGQEIALFLEKEPRPYIILDDDDDMLPEQMPNLVRTDPRKGLTKEVADEVIARFKALVKPV
jgi:hypothetical protein